MALGANELVAELRAERMATGGEAVARLDDGRVVFVAGAMAGELVRVEITESKKRFARGHVAEVLESSPARIEPPCRHVQSGECGGCDWMHIAANEQRSYKEAIVVEQLQRLGNIEQPKVSSPNAERGRRSTVRCRVIEGRAGYRARRSDRSFAAEECGAVHPGLEELIVEGDFGDATEVTLRIGSASNQRMVIINGDTARLSVPADVIVVSEDNLDNLDNLGDAAIYEDVAGLRWRVSAGSFFQTSHAGAEALVAAVARGLEDSAGAVVDLYAGVGLLGGATAAGRLQCAVESNPSSVADARHNLPDDVRVVRSRVEQWRAHAFDTVIADPARRGLGKDGVRTIEATGAQHLVLVSCDPASLGRDAGLLKEQGWGHRGAEVIDMFPDTSRLEIVSTFTR